MDASADSQAIVDRLLAEPPVVHIVDTPTGKAPGVWSTDESCYRFLARVAERGMRTLETGSGISTALFAAIGTHHRCVTPAEVEADHLRDYLTAQGISGERVQFELASSHVALPALNDTLDLVFIDGAHGFPAPIIDWFYAGSLLRRDGILVIDDIPLPGVQVLLGFLERDPRWEQLEDTGKWAAYRRHSEGSLLEGQWDQLFYDVGGKPPSVPRRVVRRLRRMLAARGG